MLFFIPKFDKLIATIRSREIFASIILQSQSQLKTITGNCDTVLFLGGKESFTLKEITEMLGKETIDLYNTCDTRGISQSYGLNHQKTGRELANVNSNNAFDVEKYLEHKLVFSQDTEFEVYEVNITEEDVKEAEQNMS